MLLKTLYTFYIRRTFLYIIFSITFFSISYTQTYHFDKYGVIEGLAQSRVLALIQDSKGYIWLGTAAGVSVFDGLTFKNYTTDDGLSSGSVRSLMEDTRGNIWLGHYDGGLTRYDGKIFEKSALGNEIIKSDITSFIETDDGKLWITTSASGAFLVSGIYEDINNLNYNQFKGNRLSDRVFGSFKGGDNTLYFITDIGIKIFNEELADFENFSRFRIPTYFSITCMYQDKNNDYWFGTHNGGVYHYQIEKEEFSIYDIRDGLAHNWISYITEDRKGGIWIGTYGGGISRIVGHEIKTFNIENGLTDNVIRCMIEDVEGNILIGTNSNGLAIFRGEYFVSFQESNGLAHSQVFSIFQDSKGKYWIGTDGGISVYNPMEGTTKNFTNYTKERDLVPEKIRFIKEDHEGKIWFGTEGEGLIYFDQVKNRFFNPTLKFLAINLIPRDQFIRALEIDDDGNLWIGTNDGLAFFEQSTGRGIRLTQYNGLAGNKIRSLLLDSGGNLWVGAEGNGLTVIKDSLIQIINLDELYTPTCMAEDLNGNIWIGTEAGGVIMVKGEEIMLSLNEKEGLLADYIKLINVDNNNNIYIGTNRGLNIYDQKDKSIFTFTRRNGFVGIEANNNATLYDKSGKLWFGTVGGVVVFDPDKAPVDYSEPLTSISRLGVNYVDREMIPNQVFNYKENSFVFEYGSISLINPDAVSYQVMLEGVEYDWRPVSKNTMEIYSGLPPGRYTFKVKASNSQGIWNSEPVTYSFRINPPWYQQWWAIGIFALLGAGFIVLYIKVREKKLITEKRILEEKVVERTIEISEKNHELAMKNKDITDSLTYAKRLQDAILPAEEIFSDTFILFKPKDIVSGDFYWFFAKNGTEILAAVDCTGHGVPGAFMSIIGHNSLNRIINEMNILKPSVILDKLNLEVYETLHKKNIEASYMSDGMDIALISYQKDKRLIEFAGAYNPLYLVRNGELIEIKGNKFPIGQVTISNGASYDNHEVEIKKGDMVYIFSDGYADQFGGPLGKKFMLKAFKKLITSIAVYPVSEQKKLMEGTLEEWQGEHEQIDDILVIGRQF